MTTLKKVEDAIIEIASKFPDPVIQALLVHKNDLGRIEQLCEEVVKSPLGAFGTGIVVYEWDGSDGLRKMFKNNIPKSGEPIAKYNNAIRIAALNIVVRRGEQALDEYNKRCLEGWIK